MKKIVSLILTIIMITALMVGCGKKVNFEENVVALVNDREIMLNEFMVYLWEMERYFEGQFGPNVWDNKDDSGKKATEIAKDEALNAAIRAIIVKDIADERGITISEEDIASIDNYVKQYFAYTDEKKISEYNITEEMVKNIFSINKLNVIDDELKDFTLSKEEVLEELKNTYGESYEYKQYAVIQEFGYEGASDEVRAKHILISTQEDKEGNPITEEDKDKVKVKAEEVLAKAKAGEDFASLVAEYSQDPGSLNTDGEYTFPRGQMADEFEDTAFALEPGEISDLVETKFGYHIIKLEEKIPATEEKIQQKKYFEKNIEEQITQYKKQVAFEDLYTTWKKEYDIAINKDLVDTIKVEQSRNILPEDTTEEDTDVDNNTEETTVDETTKDTTEDITE